MSRPLVNPFAAPGGRGAGAEESHTAAQPQGGAWGNAGGWGSSGIGAFPSKKTAEEAPTPEQAATPAALKSAFKTGNSKSNFELEGGSMKEKEAALARKEKELQKKELELIKREEELKKAGANLVKKNWPVCFPLVVHDIAKDIPENLRWMVRQVYLCYLGLVVALCWNLFCSSVMLGYDVPDKVSSWFLALIYTIAGVPLAFTFWYYRLYKAASSDRALGYFGYFFAFSIHTAFCIWAAIAVPFTSERWSFAGFITAPKAFDVNKFAGIIYIAGASVWTAEAVWSLWCIKSVYFTFRNSGGSAKARSEANRMAVQAALNSKV